MAVNLNQSPYYDDFDPAKQFTQILAVPGRALQAREFTQSQSILKHSIQQLSETLMRDGNIVSGMDFAKDGNTITVEDGLVYVQGYIHIFHEQSITLTGEGEELVGVKVHDEIVTSTQDNSLRDQAPGFVNYENPGADRLKQTVQLTVSDDEASTVYRFVDGELVRAGGAIQRDVLTDTLAKRTYDESGNYRVNGFELYTEEGDEDNIQLTVDNGRAYVLGYEVDKTTPTRVMLPKSRSTRAINNESKYFRQNTFLYTLNNNPVQEITRVNAEVRIPREQVVRGTQIGGTDFLSRQSVAVVDRVWQENSDGSVAREFIEGDDYQLVNAQGISWQPLGEEPSIGQSYFVSFRYNKVMVQGTDYRLLQEGEGANRQYSVQFLGGNADVPVRDSQFYVDYNFYLARKDLVILDKDGNIRIIEGQPDIPRLVSTPINNDLNTLHLGTVYISADSADSVPNAYSVTRLDMADLQGLMRRINDIEYNQAVTQLDREALESEQASELRGIFSDGFWNTSKADLFHEDFSVAFSLEDGQVMLPAVSTNIGQPGVQNTSQINRWGRLVSSPMTETATVRQPHSTGGTTLNPYAAFNVNAVIQLTPQVDNWVSNSGMLMEAINIDPNRVHQWWKHGGMDWNDIERIIATQSTSTSQNKINSSSGTSVLNESMQFMRERQVRFRATGLSRGANNLELTFDGRRVSITPTTGFRSGDIPGSIRANMSGIAIGTFMIPSGVRIGTRDVELTGPNDYAKTVFTAQGRHREPERTVFPAVTADKNVNPLAQSFMFDRDRILTSVGVYFSSNPVRNEEDPHHVTVQIRNMVNGFPGTTVYAEKLVPQSEITPHYRATNEKKVTFDDPVMCKANTSYCICLMGSDPGFAVFYGEMGAHTVEDNPTNQQPTVRLRKQPYVDGVLFTSSNAITWTPHQNRDLKMNIYTATFEPEGMIEFEPITNLDVDRMVLFSEYLTPTNTGCEWEVRLLYRDDAGTLSQKEWEPISNYDDTDLTEIAKELQLRATFQADRYMSPILAIDGVSLIGFMTGLEGSYVGRNVVFPQGSEYTTVTQTFDGHIPNGCSIKPYYSTDGGVTWIENSATPVIEPYDDLFNRYTYVTTVPNGTPRSNFKVKLTINALNAVARPRARRFINIAK